jgi:glycosyltransferase involved in cell wall biosynthesis
VGFYSRPAREERGIETMPPEMDAKHQVDILEPRLSILVLTYNHANYIEQCLLSLLENEFSDVHIWVLDDGSTDLTTDIVRRMSEARGGITLLTQPNSKGRTAQNLQRLIDASTSKYIMFMSGDDMLGPAFPTTKFIDYMEHDPLTGLVLPRTVAFNQSPTRESPTIYDGTFLEILQSGDPKLVCSGHLHKTVSAIFIQGMIVRRALVEQAGGFDVELTADDYAFVCRLFFLMEKTDWTFKFFFDYFWLYRIHDHNIHKNSVRQITIISETVGKYIPPQYWEDFAWHVPSVQEAEDLLAVEKILVKNLNLNDASKVMVKIVRKSLEFWCRSGNFSQIRKISFRMDFTLINKFGLVSLLLKALPFALLSPILKSPAFARSVHRLSNTLKR